MTTKKSTKTRKTGKRDSVKSLRETVEVLETQVAEQAEELEKKSDKNVRLLAEFDNYKRRTQEERSQLFKYAGEELAKAILPILDDLHRTLESDGKGKARTILEGIELIVAKLDKTLEDQGIVPFDSAGQDFNAELHEALMSEESDKGENVILREFEKGYMYNDKILRHAKVVVSKS
ncbi:nucleotide exchange factor GrpE [Marine Group I thaumarchaeote]|uniref:Protein GrpE n=1 Tax=Marine Group I thaumarchaeote TaxID=2511932 RepID=A0A7K4MPA4_9ARCH|nr:nucleotide exchange factor GrpE [Marine Group I thaumarchaeote]